MLVRELMSPEPICCTPDTELAAIAKMMTDNDCGAIPVCDRGHVVGIVTDRDIVTRAFARGGNPAKLPVSEVMTRNMVIVRSEDRVERAVELMEDRHVRRLPVVEEDQLVGMISITDLADHLAERQAGELLREVSEVPRRTRLTH